MYNFSWFFLLPGVEHGEMLHAIGVGEAEAGGEYAVYTAGLVFVIIAVFAGLARMGLTNATSKGGTMQYVPDAGLGPRNVAELLIDGILNFAEGVLNSRDLAKLAFSSPCKRWAPIESG